MQMFDISVGFLISSWNGSLSVHMASDLSLVCPKEELAPWILELPPVF